MYNLKEKAIIFIDGFINLEYKHKRAIINLYEDIEDLFDNPNPAFNYLKEIFPDIFVMNSSDIKNENGTGKYYEFYFGDNYSEFEPYYVFWFSTQLDRKEKCVIYAFLPDKIEEITVKNIV